MYVKRFLEWIGLKERLESKMFSAPFVNEGEIWWASLGENIGFEISGKSKLFTRPVIIYKKFTHSFYLVVPTTSKQRTGDWYVGLKQKDREMDACLHQIRVIDAKRLSTKLGELDRFDFERIQNSFRNLYL